MTYTYIEAKSNYHRGSILILRYVGGTHVTHTYLLTYSRQLSRPPIRLLFCASAHRRRSTRWRDEDLAACAIHPNFLYHSVDTSSYAVYTLPYASHTHHLTQDCSRIRLSFFPWIYLFVSFSSSRHRTFSSIIASPSPFMSASIHICTNYPQS